MILMIPALNFALDVKAKGHLSVIRKDISWLWRSGYNTAVGGCTEWEDLELGIATLFELTEQVCVHLYESNCKTHHFLS
jgi:hypothetical protein